MNKKGMTLVELIVSIAIMGLIMAFVAIAIRPLFNSYGAQKKLAERKDYANYFFSIVENNVHNASEIEITDSFKENYSCISINDGNITSNDGSILNDIHNEVFTTSYSTSVEFNNNKDKLLVVSLTLSKTNASDPSKNVEYSYSTSATTNDPKVTIKGSSGNTVCMVLPNEE